MQNHDLIKVPIDGALSKKTDWESLVAGVFIGWLLTLGWMWWNGRNEKPYDWCFNLPSNKSEYCADLYDQSIKYQEQFYKKYADPNEGVENDYGFR